MPPDSPSDEPLHGQESLMPFEMLYDRYHTSVYRYLYAHLGHEQDAADLMQLVFLQAWKQRQTYESQRGTIATWLLGIAHHRMVDFYRQSRPSISLDALAEMPVSDQNPEAKVLSEESIVIVRKLLASLPQAERELLTLRFAAQLSSAEIAVIIGKSEEATKKQLTRLLHRLQEQYRLRYLETPIPELEPTLEVFTHTLLSFYSVSLPRVHLSSIRHSVLARSAS